MAKQTQSHIRSLLKGISWRVIATLTTVSIVYGVTCAYGECRLSDAFKVGGAEFVLKLLIYYLHERIWQRALDNDGNWSDKNRLYKTITWRITASTTTFLLTYYILGLGEVHDSGIIGRQASIIMMFEVISKLILYYYHDILWGKIKFGRVRKFFGLNRK